MYAVPQTDRTRGGKALKQICTFGGDIGQLPAQKETVVKIRSYLTGIVPRADKLNVYYGAADTYKPAQLS